MNLLKSLLLFLTPLSIYAGSAEAVVECKSGSGRTLLKFFDQDIDGEFRGGTLSIDKKKIKYKSPMDVDKNMAWMAVNLKEGVYTLVYDDETNYLNFYAIPRTMKKIRKKEKFDAYYKFNAIIDWRSTDPRTDNILDKKIWLGCTIKYAV